MRVAELLGYALIIVAALFAAQALYIVFPIHR